MMKAYESYWKNYFNFSERTSRSGYWYVCLMNITIYFAYFFIMLYATYISEEIIDDYLLSGLIEGAGIIIPIIFLIINIIPGISIKVRRLHDINESGGWYFIQLIPYFGTIIMLLFMCMDTVDKNNRYGKQV